jgi:FixJ family two-component response regulator
MALNPLSFPGGSERMRSFRMTIPVISVADDDESVREALSSLLHFPSAQAFLDSGSLHETDCILSDMRMPGLSGLELQVPLRRAGCSKPLIFVTANASEALRRKALQEGAGLATSATPSAMTRCSAQLVPR